MKPEKKIAKTKAALELMVADQAAQIRALEDANLTLRKNAEGTAKDIAAARAEAARANENLARALGYIDRLNDQERPQTIPRPAATAYIEETTQPRGPILREAPGNDIDKAYGGVRRW